MPDFVRPDLWPPNSPNMKPVDYEVWGVAQQRVYECGMYYEQCRWAEAAPHWRLEQSAELNVIDAAINEWGKQLVAYVHADGQHFEVLLVTHDRNKCSNFEHLLRSCVTNKSNGQIKYE